MNNTKQGHTPGPWTTNGTSIGTTKGVVAKISGDYFFPEQRDANARLLAAAPEMLRVLTCITNMNDAATMRDYAQEAIHSAEGGS